MASYKDVIVDALEKKYEAQMAKAEANVKVYMENPVGVGEHPKIIEDVIELVHKASEAQDAIEMLSTIVNNEKDNWYIFRYRV